MTLGACLLACCLPVRWLLCLLYAVCVQVGDRQSLQSSRAAAEEAAKESQRQRDTKQGSLGVVLEQVRTSVLQHEPFVGLWDVRWLVHTCYKPFCRAA
jgi:hypothetical protein